jgi:hypothetical protein
VSDGLYPTATGNDQDCWSHDATYSNSANEAYVGNYGGNANGRWYARMGPLDIPAAATIDEARLIVMANGGAGTVGNMDINLVDTDTNAGCPVFDKAPQGDASFPLWTDGTVAWAGFTAGAYIWNISPDIKTLLRRAISKANYLSGTTYIGFALMKDGLSSGNYNVITQSQYGTGAFGAFLLVAYHLPGGNSAKFIAIAGTDDDTHTIPTTLPMIGRPKRTLR